jgi:hypothetical protein
MADIDFKLGHEKASIGFYRDDGDFQLLATLNNCDETFDSDVFEYMVTSLQSSFQKSLEENYAHEEILALYREDSPDYVTIEED